MVQIVDGIPVWGDPEPSSIEQIKRCVAEEHAVAGALMADHHKGYSQPIGGVVAYRDAISPSGVGYDIGCFSGDTRVFTLDGEHRTLAELDGREVHVLASTADGEIVPARATARKTRKNAELVMVTLDNGEPITCTPDHRFMLRAGDYRRADELEPGTSLMPLYHVANDDGYVLVRNNRTGRLALLHWLVLRAGLLGPTPPLESGDQLVLHHRDFRRSNNDPANLEPMGKAAHDALHALLRDRSHLGSPAFEAHRRAGIEAFWAGARADEAFMARRREQAVANGRAGAETAARTARRNGNGRRGADYLRRHNSAASRRQHGAWEPVVCPLCGQNCSSPPSLGFHARRTHPEVHLKPWRPGRSIVEQLAAAGNHKVVSVEPLDRREDVYCLEVPGFHNFALRAGVFVHNCGNKAVRTPLREADIRPEIGPIMDEVVRQIPFGIGRSQAVRVDHELFDDPAWRELRPLGALRQLAQQQLGTVGSGNHYVDLFADQDGFVWIGVHFGSRGFGHRTASGFLNLAAGRPFDAKAPGESMDQPPTVLSLDSALGQDYLAAMRLAGRYAYAGRDAVVDQVLAILGTEALEAVHNHHNFAWLEEHGGERLVVVRKGATPNRPGQRSFIGGSMGDVSVIVEGLESDEGALALDSTVHGAGRVMSRRRAAGKFNWKTRTHSGGEITREMMLEWIGRTGVELRGAGTDESPHVYKRLPEVLAAHASTLRIVHTLRPIGVAMAGEDVVDPYKD